MMSKYNSANEILATCLATIVFVPLLPILTFGLGYLSGLVLNACVGQGLINGLNTIFGTTRFTRELIPVTCATLATIGSFFKTKVSSNK